jgi:hypothetical protein
MAACANTGVAIPIDKIKAAPNNLNPVIDLLLGRGRENVRTV